MNPSPVRFESARGNGPWDYFADQIMPRKFEAWNPSEKNMAALDEYLKEWREKLIRERGDTSGINQSRWRSVEDMLLSDYGAGSGGAGGTSSYSAGGGGDSLMVLSTGTLPARKYQSGELRFNYYTQMYQQFDGAEWMDVMSAKEAQEYGGFSLSIASESKQSPKIEDLPPVFKREIDL